MKLFGAMNIDSFPLAGMSDNLSYERVTMIVQTPPHLMSKDERNDEIALYLGRASQRLLQKKRQERFEGSLNVYLKELQKPKRKRVQYKRAKA